MKHSRFHQYCRIRNSVWNIYCASGFIVECSGYSIRYMNAEQAYRMLDMDSTYEMIEYVDSNNFQIEIPRIFAAIHWCIRFVGFIFAAAAAFDENGKQPEEMHQHEQYCTKIRKVRDGCVVWKATGRWAFRMILKM